MMGHILNKGHDSSKEKTAIPEWPVSISTDGLEKVKTALTKIHDWGFDTEELDTLTGGHALSFVGWHLFKDVYNFIGAFNLCPIKLQNFLLTVESNYLPNPYHSAIHAADVTQVVHFFLHSCELSKYLTELQQMSLLFAALVHDLGHTGKTNIFLKKTRAERAVTYNDVSVQENFHISRAYQLMQDADLDIFGHMHPPQYEEIRKIAIHCVLGTDMEFHNSHMAEFESTLEKIGSNVEDWIGNDPKTSKIDVIMTMAVHVADLSNPARPFKVAYPWARRVVQEFHEQGDEEQRLGMEFTNPLNNRCCPLPDTQIGFIKYVIDKIWRLWGTLFPKVAEICMPEIQNNLEEWGRMKKQMEDSKNN